MGYQVRIGDEYFVKRTARFGAFHGRVVLTTDRYEARSWTRRRDAVKAARALIFHRTIPDMYKKKPLPQGRVFVDLEEKPDGQERTALQLDMVKP